MKAETETNNNFNHEMSLDSLTALVLSKLEESGKLAVVASDLDGTLASNHVYDEHLKVHIPQLKAKLVEYAKRLGIPLLIATGRPANDPSLIQVWNSLSRTPMPLIAENGGVVLHPNSGEIQIMPPTEIVNNLLAIGAALPMEIEKLIKSEDISPDQEILLDKSRLTSIEIRIQDRVTKRGSPIRHKTAEQFLKGKFSSMGFEATSSGSSVSIHSLETNKGKTVEAVLSTLGFKRQDIFIITLVDNHNDSALFAIADLSIGVDLETIGFASFVCPHGDEVSAAVIKAAGKKIP